MNKIIETLKNFTIYKYLDERYFIYNTSKNLYFDYWTYSEKKIIDNNDFYCVDYEEIKIPNFYKTPNDDSNFNLDKANTIIKELKKIDQEYYDNKFNSNDYILIPCNKVKFINKCNTIT